VEPNQLDDRQDGADEIIPLGLCQRDGVVDRALKPDAAARHRRIHSMHNRAVMPPCSIVAAPRHCFPQPRGAMRRSTERSNRVQLNMSHARRQQRYSLKLCYSAKCKRTC
jgi:hypothetical protein